MFKRCVSLFNFIPALLSLALICGCSDSNAPASSELGQWLQDERPHVLCTTSQVAELVAAIGADQVAVLTLITGELDPHSYQLVKGDDEKFRCAQLIFASGLGLEHGPSLQQFLNDPERRVVKIGDELFQQGRLEPIMIDGQLDPHIWLDISIWRQATSTIAQALAEICPQHRQLFSERATQLNARLEQLDEELQGQCQSIPAERRYLVTSHDAFNYFVRHYLADRHEQQNMAWAQRLCAPEGLAPEGQLSLLDIQRVVNFCDAHKVQVIFAETNISPVALRKVVQSAKGRGVKVRLASAQLYGDAMLSCREAAAPAAYEQMMRSNIALIVKELCDYDQAK